MRTCRDCAPLASVDAEDAAQRYGEDTALLTATRVVLPGTGSPSEVRAYADHLEQIAGALERWATREERQGGGAS